MRGPTRRRAVLAPAVAVLALALAGAAAAALPAPVDRPLPPLRGEQTSPVTTAVRVCPEPAAQTGVATTVTVVGRPDAASPAPAGATLAPLDGPDRPVVTLPAAGGAAAYPVPAPGSTPLVARATGGLAPGFAAEQLSRAASGDRRGLADVACAAPGTDFWFVGGGTTVGRRGRLVLTNPLDTPAQVDVTLYGPDGVVAAPGGRGLRVGPRASRVLLLDALAPGLTRTAVHVQVRAGRVAAALAQQVQQGLTPAGWDWVPVAAGPARTLTIPGVPPGGGARLLRLVAPGDRDATVQLRLLTSDGSFTPPGGDVVALPAGSVAEVDLSAGLRGRPAAVLVEADVPVTGGVVARTGADPAGSAPPAGSAAGSGGGPAELAYTAAAPLLDAAVPVAPPPAGVAASLLLTATERDATVTVTPVPAAGAAGSAGSAAPEGPASQTVAVPARRTVSVPLPAAGAAGALLVRVQPGSGPVVGARLLTEGSGAGTLLSVLPLAPTPTVEVLPAVTALLDVGAPTSR